jgi:hypothetical protein
MAGMIGGLKLTAALGYGECAQCAGALGIGLGCFVISSFCCIKCWESYKAKTSRIIAQQHLELSDVRVHTSIAEPDTDPIKRAKQYEVNPFKKVKRD